MRNITQIDTKLGIEEINILCNSNIDLDIEFTDWNHKKGGRPKKLNLQNVIEIIRMKKDHGNSHWLGLYKNITETKQDWKIPTYANFLKTLKYFSSFLIYQISRITLINRLEFAKRRDKIAYVDSTPIPVCKVIRSKRHRTMKNVAQYSKSTTGWYYGWKLHLTMDYETSRVLHLEPSEAKLDDRKYLESIMKDPKLFLESGSMFVADKGYQAQWLQVLATQTGNYLITGLKKSKKMRKILSQFDIYLIHNRAKIETIPNPLTTPSPKIQ